MVGKRALSEGTRPRSLKEVRGTNRHLCPWTCADGFSARNVTQRVQRSPKQRASDMHTLCRSLQMRDAVTPVRFSLSFSGRVVTGCE